MRVKSGVTTRRGKKKFFKRAKGFYSDKSRKWRYVKQSVVRALQKSTIDRKKKKRDFRTMWIIRLNAAARRAGMSYSQFMHGLKLAGIGIDRKLLSEIAIGDSALFNSIVQAAQKALTSATK